MQRSSKRVIPFAREDVSNSTNWFCNIARSSWDEMNMTMKNRLSSDLLAVDADIESFHARIFFLDSLSLRVE